MTRINLPDPDLLRVEHLGAEYRELPRTFGLVRKLVLKGLQPYQIKIPEQFCLGRGHVTFFYDKLDWVCERYLKICHVCRQRGRAVNYGDIDQLTEGIPSEWFNYWEPSPEDMAKSLDRLIERGGLRPGFPFPHHQIMHHVAIPDVRAHCVALKTLGLK